MLNLGVLYSSGTTVPRNLPGARDLFQKASKAGRVAALHNLGWIEQNAFPPNYNGAAAYYEQAAARGYALSMTALGGLYSQGRGVPKDPLIARHWFMLGASTGEPLAMLNLGLMMVSGIGGNRDMAEGRQWIAKAAAAGNPLAVSTLQGLERDRKAWAGRQSGTQK
jgi:TPR repeat protein